MIASSSIDAFRYISARLFVRQATTASMEINTVFVSVCVCAARGGEM